MQKGRRIKTEREREGLTDEETKRKLQKIRYITRASNNRRLAQNNDKRTRKQRN